MSAGPFVFAYGSLLDDERGVPCTLRDHRRGWWVAMDNRRTLPGYRYFLDRETGARPDVYVAFLDIRPHAGAGVNGMVFPADLDALDARERNYARVDVTELIDRDVGGPVWTYIGLSEARERCAAGRRAGTAVVWDAYLERVRAGYASHGGLDAFDTGTDPAGLPLRGLREVRVPPEGTTDPRG